MSSPSKPSIPEMESWKSTWNTVWQQIDELQESMITAHPPSGGWSIQQVIQHLALSESLSLTYLKKKIQDPGRIPPRDVWYPWRRMALRIYLKSPLRFKAPALVTEDRFPQHERMAQTLDRLKANQQELEAFLQDLPDGMARKMIYRHPIAGRLDIGGMFIFFNDHIRHHQRQIRRILSELPRPENQPGKLS